MLYDTSSPKAPSATNDGPIEILRASIVPTWRWEWTYELNVVAAVSSAVTCLVAKAAARACGDLTGVRETTGSHPGSKTSYSQTRNNENSSPGTFLSRDSPLYIFMTQWQYHYGPPKIELYSVCRGSRTFKRRQQAGHCLMTCAEIKYNYRNYGYWLFGLGP